ncbi:hypothetical protein OLZ90_003838 [Salmonella enterica]|nr:hypothetical protein [Salmonella enterica]
MDKPIVVVTDNLFYFAGICHRFPNQRVLHYSDMNPSAMACWGCGTIIFVLQDADFNLIKHMMRISRYPGWRKVALANINLPYERQVAEFLGIPMIDSRQNACRLKKKLFAFMQAERSVLHKGWQKLSAMQARVVLYTLNYESVTAIVSKTGMTNKTVYAHRSLAYHKLGVRNTTDLQRRLLGLF